MVKFSTDLLKNGIDSGKLTYSNIELNFVKVKES